jgi:phosphoserine phosphatase
MIPELDALPSGEAVFDMDGTLIDHDVAEACLRGLDRHGFRNEVTRAAPGVFDAYCAIPDYEAQCRYAALALGGLRIDEVEALVDEAFARGEVAPVPAVCELAAALALRHRVWLVTASPEVIGRAVGKRLGLYRVRGVQLPVEADRLRAEVVGYVPCGAGKIRATWELTGRVPHFAIGDSPQDLPLLRHARVARTCGKNAGVEFPAWP